MASTAPSRPKPTHQDTAHDIYAEFHTPPPPAAAKFQLSLQEDEASNSFDMFRNVMKTGVLCATSRAQKHGFKRLDDPEWANMGQGAPETGPLSGAPSRNFELSIEDAELEYASTAGIPELRSKVAEYYNTLYRTDKSSQYTHENVCIVPGGRAGLTRIMAVLGKTQVGYFTPDYTAYQEALGLFTRITPSPLIHRDAHEALMTSDEFHFQAAGRGLGVVLLSNPANPTGQSIEGTELKAYVDIARELNTALVMDEFYSHYYYDGTAVDPVDGGVDDASNFPKTVSSATCVDNVNIDPIIIVNGLTKNWRLPGFRICWIVAPKRIVEMLSSAGSFLDGGANAPLQKLALPMMDMEFIRRDTWALQRHFKMKRDFLLRELTALGISVEWHPTATFYIWANLSALPHPLDDCLVFLEECVKHKVIIVPGVFFDINPNHARNIRKSTCINFVRFSYGPGMKNLEIGVKQIGNMIEYWKNHVESADQYAKECFGGLVN